MNSEERQEKIELYGRGYDMLTTAVPQEAWQFKSEPTEWSGHEIIIHLADSESNAALRARKLAVAPGGTLMGYDQDRWATELNYHDHDPEDALQVTKYARLTTYKWLKTLPEEVFTNTVIHPEHKEPYSFEMWLNSYSEHIPGHIAQIKNNIKIWRERK
jgi:hypothetical protein